jgi:hypothetical protein
VKKVEEAEHWLVALFGDGPQDAVDVLRLAEEQGFTARTVRRASANLEVRKTQVHDRDTGVRKWVWSLAAGDGDAGHLRAGEILAGLVLPNGKTLGECAAPVQVADWEAVLASEPEARRFWIGRGRGYSKTGDAAGMTIAAVLGGVIEPGERGFFCAADKDQARLAADAIQGWARRSDLGKLVVVEASRVKFPAHDVEVEIMSSDAPSAWGRGGSWWVVDELTSWADAPNARDFYQAISTAWPKVPHARVIVIATAGSPAHFSHAIYQAALTDPVWRVSDCHDVAPWINPADIEGERARLSAASFSRLWCNEWVEAEDHLVTAENLARCATLTDWPVRPQHDRRYVVGVDVGVKFDNTAVCVAHTETDGGERRVVCDDMVVFKPRRGAQVPLKEVEDRVEALARRYHGAEVAFDPNQALSMLQALKGRGVRVEENPITARWNDRMATLLHTMLRDGLLDLPTHHELLEELLTVRVVETAQGLLSIDTRPGRHDDQVDALGICATKLMERAQSRPGRGFTAAAMTIDEAADIRLASIPTMTWEQVQAQRAASDAEYMRRLEEES